MARAMDRIDRVEGILGRMLSADAQDEQAADLMTEARALFGAIGRILAMLERSAGNAERLTAGAAGPQGVPALLRRADGMLANLPAMMTRGRGLRLRALRRVSASTAVPTDLVRDRPSRATQRPGDRPDTPAIHQTHRYQHAIYSCETSPTIFNINTLKLDD